MSPKRVKVGIVGWGEIARDHASHLGAAGAELAGVVSRKRDLTLDVPVYRSVEELFPHVDALTVAVPNHMHATVCLDAIRAGKALLLEKPLVITGEELEEIELAFAELTVPVHLGYRLRWNPSMIEVKRRIEGLRRIHCVYRLGIEELAREKDWTRKFATTGGTFFTLGIHTLDLADGWQDAGARSSRTCRQLRKAKTIPPTIRSPYRSPERCRAAWRSSPERTCAGTLPQSCGCVSMPTRVVILTHHFPHQLPRTSASNMPL